MIARIYGVCRQWQQYMHLRGHSWFDKAWLTAIMYVMHKQGLTDNNWRLIKKMNEDLKARIATKHGDTDEIVITDSIRQGGVLSGLQYALLMDEVAKDIDMLNMGITLDTTKDKIGCLLWMDDVVLITTNPEDQQKILDITNDTSLRYHIEYGKPKSKVMKIGSKIKDEKFHLGNMDLEFTTKYKYLGTVKNDKNNLKDHITEIKSKCEAAFQTILALAGNLNFKGLEMEVIWKTVEACIIAILTYGGEVWCPNKTESKEINKILDSIIKRILILVIAQGGRLCLPER